MNKKAYIRTLEAVVAILIIYIFTTSLLAKNNVNEASVPKDIELTQESILKEIQSSEYYRNCILSNNNNCINSLFQSSIKNIYGYNFSICTVSNCVVPATPEKEVYAKSLIVTANLTNYSTTSVNLYIWRKI